MARKLVAPAAFDFDGERAAFIGAGAAAPARDQRGRAGQRAAVAPGDLQDDRRAAGFVIGVFVQAIVFDDRLGAQLEVAAHIEAIGRAARSGDHPALPLARSGIIEAGAADGPVNVRAEVAERRLPHAGEGIERPLGHAPEGADLEVAGLHRLVAAGVHLAADPGKRKADVADARHAFKPAGKAEAVVGEARGAGRLLAAVEIDRLEPAAHVADREQRGIVLHVLRGKAGAACHEIEHAPGIIGHQLVELRLQRGRVGHLQQVGFESGRVPPAAVSAWACAMIGL
jgi:hypothetical protein